MNRFLPALAVAALFALPLHAEENTKLAHEEEAHEKKTQAEPAWYEAQEQLTGNLVDPATAPNGDAGRRRG